jgi:hypothetical protein
MKRSLFIAFAISFTLIRAQTGPQLRTCATPTLPQQFENWVKSITPAASSPKLGSSSIQSVFNIPVIVHIIHNNESVNSISATSGNNLNAAQVQDQINILNKDYNGLNADTSLIPTVFKPSLGKFQVNFCLAVVNPTGGILAEPGIDRINRVAKGWSAPPYTTTYVDATIKGSSIWDPNKYLNIWVCGMSGGILGYATFPNPGASGLAGLSSPYGTATTDGVVILNTSFGSIGTAQFGSYNLGRTATHEIGHWMGLRHIWGDGTCATDYVNDTPPHQTANYGCPSFPYKLGTCSGNTTGEMTMNYMDYTNDACMYMFTKDQKIRAQLILVNSSIRAALITSTVCNLPTLGTDVGISSVARPSYTQNINCFNYVDPIINVTNYGTTTLTSFVVTYNMDNGPLQTFTWTGSASPNTTFTLAIPQISGLVNGPHTFSVNLSNPNNGTDLNLSNNNNMQNFTIANIMNVTVTTATTCAGVPAVVTASGAVNYNWGPGITTSSHTVSPTITTVYSVTASNSACTIVKTTTVTVNPGPTITVNNPSVCAATPVTLSASGANSYSWNTGATSNTISVSSPVNTVYVVSGTNSLGCVSSSSSNINILTTPTLAVNNITVCSGGTATLFASGASTYSWSTGSNLSSATVAPAGFSIYTVNGNIGTCSDSKTVSVAIGSAITIFITPSTPAICVGGSVALTATGANSYTWSTTSNSSSIVVAPLVTTTYTVLALAGTCPGSQVVSVTVNNLPQIAVSATNVLCSGGSSGKISATSTGNGPFSYTYSSGPSGLAAGTYTVFASDVFGCRNQSTVTLTQPSPLTASNTTGDTYCPLACNGTAQIQVSGGTSPYTGTLMPGNISGSTFTTLCAGSYNYLITDANGCPLSSNFVVNGGNNGIAISSTVTNVSCSSCSDATITADGGNGTGPYTYTWIPGNVNGPVLTNASAGCYTVTAADAQGCSAESVLCVSFDVGIKKLTDAETILVTPNPADGIFNLQSNESGIKTIEIFDASGRYIVDVRTEASSTVIDISAYSKGIYYARITTRNNVSVVKLISQ